MQVDGGTVAAVPGALVAAGRAVAIQAEALRAAHDALLRAGRGAGCVGRPQAAVDELVGTWAPALTALGLAAADLSLVVTRTAGEFQRADGG